MFNDRESSVRTLVVATMIMVLAFVAVACGPKPTPESTAREVAVEQDVEVTPEQETEVVEVVQVPPGQEAEVVEVVQAPPEQEAEEVLMVAATQDEQEVLLSQIERFDKEHRDIVVKVIFVSPVDFYETLLKLIEAGAPPDVAVLSYNHIALLRDYLQPLDDWIQTSDLDISDFLPDAVDSNTFDKQLYGLPWLRSACLPRYRNLALFQVGEPSEFQVREPSDAAFRLMDFLTQRAQQYENYNELKWFPTRQSVYARLGIACPPLQAIRPAPEVVSQTVALVEERWPVLGPVLQGQTINPYEAATEIKEGEASVTVAPVMTGPSTEAEFVEAARSGDVVIGALFVEGGLGYGYKSKVWADGSDLLSVPPCSRRIARSGVWVAGSGDPTGAGCNSPKVLNYTLGYPPAGDYAVRCRLTPKGLIPCYLVKPDGQEIQVESKVSFTKAPVGQPFCLAIEDSSGCICFDSRCYCFW